MLRKIGIVLLTITVSAVCGCGGNSAVQQPSTTPPPSPTPSISSISPKSATAGSPDLTLTITGTNLAGTGPRNSRRAVWWANGTNTTLSASTASSTELAVLVPAALMTVPVTAQVFVEYGDAMGDVPLARTKAVSFVVTAATVASISPAMVALGPRNIQQFEATFNGKALEAAWSVEEGDVGGNITQTGLYTAPANVGTFHVLATLISDPSENARATVSVLGSGFSPTGSMNRPRSGHSATLLADGKVLVVGGDDDSAELFDPATRSFSLTGRMTTPRYGATVTALANGKVLVAGGSGPETILNTAELYDPSTGIFSSTGNMLQGRSHHTATLLNDGRVLIAGGYVGLCSTANAELFDPATGTFSSALLLSARVSHTATLLKSGEVLMAGGSNGCRPDASDDPPWDPIFVELFDPSSNRFQAAGNMSTTRIGHASILLGDGKVLVLGGIPAVQNLHEQPPDPSYAELYDPVLHTISPVAALTLPQTDYTATLLNSGMVLIDGGASFAGKPIADAWLIDPSSHVLSATGSLGYARVGHTASLLRDGRVLVTGGTDSNGKALASAELYH